MISVCHPIVTFVHEVANAGYRTVLAGRMHFKGPDLYHGFRASIGDIGNPSWSGKSPGTRGRQYQHYGAGHAVLEEAGPGKSRVMEYDSAVIDAACERMAAHNEPRALFMTVGVYGPHNPYVCEPELFAYYYEKLPRLEPEGIPDDTFIERQKMEHPDAEAMHRARAAYRRRRDLGRRLGRLEDGQEHLGERGDFYYSTDHGDLAGSHGTFWKQSFYEGSVRVPMMWAGLRSPRGST